MKELTPAMAERVRAEVNSELERLELPAHAQTVTLDDRGRIVIDLFSTGTQRAHLGAGRGHTPARAIGDAVSLARAQQEG